jgi:ribosome-binding factor A
VGELIQQEVSRIVQDLKDPGLGFVTVTGVKLSDDLKFAKIFYSVIGSPEDVKRSGDVLKRKTPEVRHELASRLNLRRTPEIRFDFDETPERASRIFTLLEKIKEEESAAPKPEEKPEEKPETKQKKKSDK